MRDYYIKRKQSNISYLNEPKHDIQISCSIKEYPDMFMAYQKFGTIFNVSEGTFILGSGCENIIKNALLALNAKELSWSKPAWNFIEVYVEQLRLIPHIHEFKLHDNIVTEEDFNENVDIYYGTYKTNNVLCHEMNFKNIRKSRYSIIDISYLNIDQIKRIIYDIPKNVIYVGSFDKLYGCGLRLGFAFFNENIKQEMFLQRENFINSMAYQFLMQFDKYEYIKPEYNTDGIFNSFNFYSKLGNIDIDGSITKKFKINGIQFTRIGV